MGVDARNYIVPQGKAYEATKANLRHVEALKTERARHEAEELVATQELATKFSKLKPQVTATLTITVDVGDVTEED
jgi:large subunit ribosomal protein L9